MAQSSETKKIQSQALLATIFITITGGVLGDFSSTLIKYSFYGETVSHIYWRGFGLVVTIVFFAASLMWLYSLRKGLFSTSANIKKIDEQRKILVFGISSIPVSELKYCEYLQEQFSWSELTKNDAEFKKFLKAQSVPEEFSKEKFRWQQNLRAIAYHLGTLKKIIIIPPKREKNHIEKPHEIFKDYIKKFKELENIQVEFIANKELDYNDYNEINNIVAQRIESEPDKKSLCIDVTAGTKVFSTTLAINTLNSDALLEYVDNDGKIRLYDLDFSFSDIVGT